MRKSALLCLQVTVILKSNDLESSFDKEYIKTKYQDVFWGNNFKAINLLQKANLKQKKSFADLNKKSSKL